jgi:hypothetical protein
LEKEIIKLLGVDILKKVNGRVAIAGRFYDPLLPTAMDSTNKLIKMLNEISEIKTIILISKINIPDVIKNTISLHYS